MTVPGPDLAAAAQRLDPASRALLSLWVDRGLGDGEIASLIRSTPEGVAVRRHTVIERLAADLQRSPLEILEAIEEMGVPVAREASGTRTTPEAIAEPDEHLALAEMPAGANPILSRTVPPPGAATGPEPPRAAAWRRADPQVRTAIVILVLVIASLALLVVALLAGSSDSSTTTSRPTPTHAGAGFARAAHPPTSGALHRLPGARTVARRPGQANAKASASTA